MVSVTMRLRVLSVNDGKEWLLPLRDGEQQVQVAHIKRLVLQQIPQIPQISRMKKTRQDECKCEGDDGADEDGDDDEDGESSSAYVMFRGRILADMDFFNLNTLTASDFFVFAQEDETEEGGEDDTHASDTSRIKRKRDPVSVEEASNVQQLMEMGFSGAQVQSAMQQTAFDMTHAIAILTGDASAMRRSEHTAAVSGSRMATRELVRRHPQLEVLQPVLGEMQMLDVQHIAASDSFQAIMVLKQHVSNESLARVNAHPCAAIRFFRLPPPQRQQQHQEKQAAGAEGASVRTSANKKRRSSSDTSRQESSAVAIDLVNSPFAHVNNDGDGSAPFVDVEAIARVRFFVCLW